MYLLSLTTYVFESFQEYFESLFIKPNNFYINIYNINLSKKFMKIAFFKRLKWVESLKGLIKHF